MGWDGMRWGVSRVGAGREVVGLLRQAGGGIYKGSGGRFYTADSYRRFLRAGCFFNCSFV